MDLQQIEATLADLFQRDDLLPRQLVFWYDDNGDFKESVGDLALPAEVETIELGDTPFAIKYRLLVQQPDTSFLLYAPHPEPDPLDNWLLDVQMQAERFSADRAALLFRHYGLYQRSLQGYFKAHLKFFDAQKRRDALETIGLAKDSDETDVRLAMMCAALGLKVADAGSLVRAVLMAGLDEENNEAWQTLKKHFDAAEFWEVVRMGLGVPEGSSLRDLLIRLALSHLDHDLNASLPDTLQPKLVRPGTKAYVFVDAWLRHSEDASRWAKLSAGVASDLGLGSYVSTLSPDDYSDVETFELFDTALVRSAAEILCGEPSDDQLGALQGWIRDRKTRYWFEKYRHHYEALEAARDLIALLRQVGSFARPASELFEAYTETYYQIDQRYRHYIAASDRVTDDSLKVLGEGLEPRYTQDFLEPIGAAWSDALAALGGRWQLPTEKQWFFYKHSVETILSRSDREKAFVVIADAFRFEVAAELRERLLTELRGEATLEALTGVLPSVTMLGMAALLPHDTLSVDDSGAVLADGRSTQGSAAREAVLNATGTSSVVLKAADLLAMTRDEARAAVQPHRVVYIYQDTIDATGDKPANEARVFEACQEALAEIDQVVRKIVNQLNGSNVLVTSDHGFLYQRQTLAQHDKVPRPDGEILDSGRRHQLGRQLSQPEGSQTFDLAYLHPDGLQAQSPRGTLRYKLQGGGSQYVHGGASLQEVCVPLLRYKHVRASKGDEGPSRRVGVQVSSTQRRITNRIFSVRLVQADPVGGRVKPRQVRVAFVDEDGAALTNVAALQLESEAKQATDREYIARMRMGSSPPTDTHTVYLVVTDADDDLELVREPWQLSLAFGDDFGDF